jgi:DNA (cytosine-5)-methyltransferase 3A
VEVRVLSLFDGMSCGQIALNRAGIHYDEYFASEIDKHAITVTQSNYPNTVQLGDVTNIRAAELPKIDLLIGGSPCQGLSRAGLREGLEDHRSRLFYEYARLFRELKPKWFLLENVKMDAHSQSIISEILGVEPVLINSSNFSAQNRERLYWTNIPVAAYVAAEVYLQDILETHGDFKWVRNTGTVTEKRHYLQYDVSGKGHNSATQRAYYPSDRHGTLRASAPHAAKVITYGGIRHLTRTECERLQTVPDGYTSAVSENQAKKMLGNGWTVDVIAHIFYGLKLWNGEV